MSIASQQNPTTTKENLRLNALWDTALGFVHNFCLNKGALVALCIFLLLLCCAVFAPWIAPHSPIEQFRDHIMNPPAFQQGGDLHFLLGTDDAGRDILSRLIYGARLSYFIGILSVLVSLLPGVFLGLIAAFFPKWVDALIMRLVDILLAIPSLLLAVAIVAVLGPGLTNTILAVSIVSLPYYVRLSRASALIEKKQDYVLASTVAGAKRGRLMFLVVLPNCMAPLIVQATLSFSTAVLDTAALGFLGLGVQPPLAEWGTMLASAKDYIQSAWWIVTLPGIAILMSVIAINLIGDGLRDTLDPKLKKIS